MKTKIFITLALTTLVSICFISCNKNEPTPLADNNNTNIQSEKYQEYLDYKNKVEKVFATSNAESYGHFPIKIKIGTYLFNNCSGSNPCGPCAGICIRFGSDRPKKPRDFNMADINFDDYVDGYRYIYAIDNRSLDNTISLHLVSEDIVNNDGVIIEEDLEIINTDIILKEGTYEVDYSPEEYDEVKIDVIQ